MKKMISVFVALAALATFGIDKDTEFQDVPGNATLGEVVAAGGGGGGGVLDVMTNGVSAVVDGVAKIEIRGGGGGDVDTNAVIDIIHNTVDGSARPLPKYLHLYETDDSYPEAAQEYYRSRGDGKTDGGCSAFRDGGFLYRNFDFPFDDRAEFVVKMSAGAGRFASVGVAQVGTNLTEQMVTSGKPEFSARYKWLPGATVDGINENGVVCEINVVDGDPQTSGWHETGDIHPLGAVRWALDNGTSAGMVASNIAANIRFPQGWAQNFHYMVADETATYIVENGTAYPIIGRPVLTNFRIAVNPPDGPGVERYNILMDPESSITNVWFTLCYERSTNPPWLSEFGNNYEYWNAALNAWELKPKEAHRGEIVNGESWWQSIHTSIYDITNRTLRVAVQEQDDWYVFAVPSAGGVKVETDPTVPAWAKAANPPAVTETDPTVADWARKPNPAPVTDLTPATNYTDAAVGAAATAATNYTDAAITALDTTLRAEIAAHTPGNYETVSNRAMRVNIAPVWQETDSWGIRYRNVTTNQQDEVLSVSTNAAGQVFETRVNTVTQTRVAECWAVGYDLYTGYQPRILEWSSFGGSTITPDGRLTAPSNGWYNVLARADNGTTESKLVPIQVKHYIDGDKTTTYTADIPSDRKAVNDLALSVLKDGEYKGQKTASDGSKFDYYDYDVACPFAAPQAGSWGSSYSFAIADHLLANAAHYGLGAIATGPQTIGDVTVMRQRAISLADWARTNGWTDAEISQMNIKDIAIQPCTGSAIPDEALPYLMDWGTAYRMLDAHFTGINGWYTTRDVTSPQPLTFSSVYGDSWDYSNNAFTKLTDHTARRADINAVMKSHGVAYSVHVGDSGHPIFFTIPNVGAVVVSHFHGRGAGPSYIRAFPILKKYCEMNGYHMRELAINE